jgi:hypothetical protein
MASESPTKPDSEDERLREGDGPSRDLAALVQTATD